MFEKVTAALLLIVAMTMPSEARPFRATAAPGCNVIFPCDFSGMQSSPPRWQSRSLSYASLRQANASAGIRMSSGNDRVRGGHIVGSRPAGCPRAFCGCGAAIRVFGRIVPELNLASNWLRFPRTAPAPGMVAARRGHVFVLEQHVGGDVWMAYDANSGGHATRIHARSLRGYVVVNPRAA